MLQIGANLRSLLKSGDVLVGSLHLEDAAFGFEVEEGWAVGVALELFGKIEAAIGLIAAGVFRMDDGADLRFQRIADGMKEVSKGRVTGSLGNADAEGVTDIVQIGCDGGNGLRHFWRGVCRAWQAAARESAGAISSASLHGARRLICGPAVGIRGRVRVGGRGRGVSRCGPRLLRREEGLRRTCLFRANPHHRITGLSNSSRSVRSLEQPRFRVWRRHCSWRGGERAGHLDESTSRYFLSALLWLRDCCGYSGVAQQLARCFAAGGVFQRSQ